ncbi:hypothetical protein B1H19_04940 [Streptomyces gilvosporeus]|uniref:Uncharacterized protein n=1 Tax=Streptomyces gilvosporeus TaxID=553510 RepID=A0A1V0TL13_9ACTN|nr:hypothetical protein B1H19_04940 [Streptomyces gilvosporeus]
MTASATSHEGDGVGALRTEEPGGGRGGVGGDVGTGDGREGAPDVGAAVFDGPSEALHALQQEP